MSNVNTNTCWNIVLSSDTDIAFRQFLASQGGGRKGDLLRFKVGKLCRRPATGEKCVPVTHAKENKIEQNKQLENNDGEWRCTPERRAKESEG